MNQLVNIVIMEEKFVQAVELFSEELFRINIMKFLYVSNQKIAKSIYSPEKVVSIADFKNVWMQAWKYHGFCQTENATEDSIN